MTAVPMLQALSWGEESPLRPSGEVDVEALAHGLARSDYPGGRRRQPYTRAQHAVVVSEAVETLAGLRLPERRVLAMHAWLAEVRDAELRDRKDNARGRGQGSGWRCERSIWRRWRTCWHGRAGGTTAWRPRRRRSMNP